MDMQVTCIVPDGPDSDMRIEAIGGASGGPQAGPWQIAIDEAIAGIEEGRWVFFTLADGRRAEIRVKSMPDGRKFLKSDPDGFEPNNLRAQETCP